MSVKPYTKYRCPTEGCGSTMWSGAMGAFRPTDEFCHACGSPWAEVVEDGHTYRVAWEAIGPYDTGWHPVHKDHADRIEAVDQYRTLAEWERTGQENVRAVTITRSTTVFEPWDPGETTPAAGEDLRGGGDR